MLLLPLLTFPITVRAVREERFRDWFQKDVILEKVCSLEVKEQAWRQMTADYVPNPYRHGQAVRFEVHWDSAGDGVPVLAPEDEVTFGCPLRIPYQFDCTMTRQQYSDGLWSPCPKVYQNAVPDAACVAQGKVVATTPRTREQEVRDILRDANGYAVVSSTSGCPMLQTSYQDCGTERYYPFTRYCIPVKLAPELDDECQAGLGTLPLAPKQARVLQPLMAADGTTTPQRDAAGCPLVRESYIQCQQYKEFLVGCQDVLGEPIPDPACPPASK